MAIVIEELDRKQRDTVKGVIPRRLLNQRGIPLVFVVELHDR